MKWKRDQIVRWLGASRTSTGGYVHVLLTETESARGDGLSTLRELVERAHADAVRDFSRVYRMSLDPLESGDEPKTPADRYPHGLHTSTLQGYLGEIFAGVVAENHDPHDIQWTVPGFLFRLHEHAREELERRFQLGGPARPIPGKSGDDCVAFALGGDGTVAAWLNMEAKCTSGHDTKLLDKGHKQLSAELIAPVSLYRLVDLVRSSDDPLDAPWVAPLELWLRGGSHADRYDMLMYVCGRRPIKKSTWMTTDAVHGSYTRTGPLAAIEAHLDDFDDVVRAAYPGHEINRA